LLNSRRQLRMLKSFMDCALSRSSTDKRLLRLALLRWYDAGKRDLPWRRNKDPYRIWVSEIMLQQTRVSAVLEHYREFLARFPAVEDLASAKLDAVLAAWSGLGYYRRARNLHAAAQKVVAEFEGRLPVTAVELRQLPGIGRYTAAAIASIAYNEKCAVLDGNVERVLGRVLGQAATTAELWKSAEDLLSPQRPGDFNQAMMELGATVCLPAEPCCLLCPIHRWCETRGAGSRIPQAKRKLCELDIALVTDSNRVKLVRRSKSATVMTGMWELPTLAVIPDPPASPVLNVKHSIMNTDYRVRVWRVSTPASRQGRWWSTRDLPNIPLTGLARKILRRAALF
jgi:A/G-specific adenine glycosylase